MPTVPTYGAPKVQEQALPSVYKQPIREDAFGGAIAEGVQGLGQGLGQAANAADQLQQMHDEATVRQLDVQYGETVRHSLYDPTNGFLFKSGQDALTARPAVEQQLTDTRNQLAGQLQNARQQRLFTQAMAARQEQTFTLIDSHAQSETKNFLVNSTRASAETHLNSAISAFDVDPQASITHLEAARDAQRQADALQGVGQDVHLVNDHTLTSNFWKSIILAKVGKDDGDGAQHYLDLAEPEMTAADRLAVMGPVRDAVDRQSAFNFRMGLEGGGASAPAPGAPAASGIAGKIRAAAPDPQTAANIITFGMVESGLGANARKGSSQGLFQFHPDTFARYGGDPAKINDPDEQIKVMLNAYADEKAKAQKALGGQEPAAWQVYLVHQQGAGGGPALLGADPNASAISTLEAAGVSPATAQKSIMGNLPQAVRSKFGPAGPTVGQFLGAWQGLFARKAGQGAQAMQAATVAPGAATGAGGAQSVGVTPASGFNNTSIPLPPDREHMVQLAYAASGGDPRKFNAMVAAGDQYIASARSSIRQQSQAAIAAVQPFLQDPKVKGVQDIPGNIWNALPETTQTELMKHFAEGGVYPKQPDPVALAYLHNEMVTNPDGFANEDLTKWVGKLDKESYQKMLSDQDEARKGSAKFRVKQDTTAQVMATSQAALTAAGLDAKTKDGAPKIAQLQTRMTTWADQFENANKRPPNPKEIRDQLDGFLLQGSESAVGGADLHVFEHMPGKPFSYAVPAKVKQQLTAQFQAKYGRPPTDVQLGQLWRAGHAAGLFGGY